MTKMRAIFVVILLFFSLSLISAVCDSEQVDVNSASVEELEEIDHVGPKVAEYIIERRPFVSLDDLDRVPYISPGYIEDIKSQGLACVDTEVEEEETNGEKGDNVNVTAEINVDVNINNSASDNLSSFPRNTNLNPIDLNPQIIKTNNSEVDKNNYAIYGLVAFSILIIALLILKKREKRNELE